MVELFTGLSIGRLKGQLSPVGYFSLSQIVTIPTSSYRVGYVVYLALAMMPVQSD